MCTTAPLVVALFATSRHLPSACTEPLSASVHVWFGPGEQVQVCGWVPVAVLPSVTSRHVPLSELTSVPEVAAYALVRPATPSAPAAAVTAATAISRRSRR